MKQLEKEFYEILKSDPRIFHFIQEISLDGILFRDIENPEDEWINAKFWLTLGYQPDEIPEKPLSWQQQIHPEDLERVRKEFESTGATMDTCIRFIHKNGSTVWKRFRGETLQNTEGRAVRMIGTFKDITGEKTAEEKHKLILDSIDEGFCIIEMIFNEQQKPVDYRFLFINASFEQQTGLSNAVGKRMREFAPKHEEHWFETYGKIALTGKSMRFENRAEQLHRWYDVYAFRYGDPKNYQVAILFNDITKRRITEDTIKRLNDELEDNLKLLESMNKELESFSYSVSHDLRAPLRAINGYAAILTEDYAKDLPEGAVKNLDAICKNSHKMGTLIDDLLTFSRLGRKEVAKHHVDIQSIVNEVVDDTCQLYHLKKSVFTIGSLPPAHGDEILLKQVWINLISNARKYSQLNPDQKIEIGFNKIDDEVVYFIKDNGVGFDMKYYDKLFGVFQRLHNDGEFEGTGVGLAIVQRIIVRHGGRVWAEAKVNGGASFYFSIPVPLADD